ncbi:hypothetical protein DFP73DRAFT_483705, partial [Morchella snyderi]
VQYTFPLFLGIVLAGLIQNASTANTWSVISTLLQNSYLHTVLVSDSTTTTHIARPVLLLYYLGLLSLVLIALSGVITPLGIHEDLKCLDVHGVRFELALDNDSFALGTADRTLYGLTRVCGAGVEDALAQADFSVSTPARLARRANGKTYRIGSGLPAPLSALFAKASFYGASVASVLDIQFRNYIILDMERYTFSGGKAYTIGQFRFLETLILTRGHKLIDGLIVDTKSGGGGVGFRRHAVPDRARRRFGAIWEETLLWVAPETVCVANNVSLQVTTDNKGGAVSMLVDTGGFRGLAGVAEPDVLADMAGVPDLAGRAWRGAYYFNRDVGKAVGASRNLISAGMVRGLGSCGRWVTFLSRASLPFIGWRWGRRLWMGSRTRRVLVYTHCAGLTLSTRTGAPLVTCGLIVGAPHRTEGDHLRLAGTHRYPLYTCATAVRASLRATTFMSNGTTRYLGSGSVTLQGSTLLDPPPLWGIESPPSFTATRISPLWGPLHPTDRDAAVAAGITVREVDYLYLPAGQGGNDIQDSLAGTGAYQYAAGLIYESSPMTPDYSGRTNYALYRQWERATVDPRSAAELPNLVWTDVFANSVTAVSTGGKSVSVVRVYSPVLRYDMRYAIPVGITVGMWAGILAVGMVFWLGRRVRVRELRQLLNQVSTGRVVVNMLEESKEGALPAKSWAAGKGKTVVGLDCRGIEDQAEEFTERVGGYEIVGGGMVVGFVEAPTGGRVMDLLKGRR